MLVRWHDGVAAARRDGALAGVPAHAAPAGLARVRISAQVDAVVPASDGASSIDVEVVLATLGGHPDVAAAEPDRVLVSRPAGELAPAPDDAYFTRQWALDNPGTLIGRSGQPEEGVAGIDIRVREAWLTTRGRPEVRVAVIDTAIDDTHPDLVAAAGAQVSMLDGPLTPGVHGSSVAGIIGAVADNGFGVAGVAPGVTLIPIAAFETRPDGGPGAATLASVLGAFAAAADAEVDVINASWVTSDASDLLADAIASSGVPVVAASGNDGLQLTAASRVYPVGFALPNVVAVTAIDRSGGVASFANTGPGVVDVAAPGVDILAVGTDQQHVWASGTSFAAPHVSGAIALAKSAAPYATTHELVDVVQWTSRPVSGLVAAVRTGAMLDAGAMLRGIQRPVCRSDELAPVAFFDVHPDGVHASAISCIAANGITTGRADGTFGPSRPVTRAQLASFLARILADADTDTDTDADADAPSAAPAASTSAPDFLDVDPDSTHADAIGLLASLGIVMGDEDGRFRPEATVTRGQMASLLVRTHEYLTGTSRPPSRVWFPDATTSTHATTISRARDLGLVRGVSRDSYDAGAPTGRGQMASFLARLLDTLERGEVHPG